MAVETILVGNVRDAGTGLPIENANVFFKHTQIGTTTNAEGFFYLRLDVKATVKLTISAVGYKKEVFEIEPGISAGMEVLLEEKIARIEEITALPGENPAIDLMRQVRDNRRANAEPQVRMNDAEKTMHQDVNYYISDIQPRHLKKHFYQQFQSGMIMREDSSYIMPLPDNLRADVALPLPETFDFYQATIPFHSVSFLSPLAAGANGFYRFYLVDSLVIGYGEQVEKHYIVHFLPKNTFDPLLHGTLEIDSATYALRHIEASASRNTNINYLNGLTYTADYMPNNQLAQEDLSALFEVGVKSDTTHFFPSLIAERKSRRQADIPLRRDTIIAGDSAVTSFLSGRRPQPIAPDLEDSVLLAMKDSMMNIPLLRVARWLGEIVYSGYIPTGTCVDIGKVTDIIRYTPEEHLYLGLPFRTNQKLWPHVSLGGYVGYGFRDRGVKWKAEIEVLIPAERRHLLRLTASDRYAYTDVSAFDALKYENSISGTNMRFTSWILNGVQYNKNTAQCTAARRREVQIVSENDWTAGAGKSPGVETTVSVQIGRQGYGDPLAYGYYDQPSYRYASLRGIVRLGWHETTADFFTTRKHFSGKYPTLYVGAEMGSYHYDDEENYHMYGKLNVMLKQDVQLGVGGVLSYLFDAGLIMHSRQNELPYPILAVMNGNQGVTYMPERFTLMNMGQYAADKYMQMHLHWDGRGILFGRIPGIRYCRLHELVEAKMAWGGLSQFKAPDTVEKVAPNLQALTIPYTELGLGIGNILRIGEVYSVWRLTHRDDPAAALWAVRFRLHFAM